MAGEEPQAGGSRSGTPRPPQTMLGVLRRFGRLWGFLAFAVLVLVLFRGIVLPFVFAMLLAYLLAPIIARMQPKIGRVLAIIVVYLAILGILGGTTAFLVPAVFQDLAKLRETLPTAAAKLNEEYLPRASAWVEETFGDFMAEDEATVPPTTEVVAEPLADGSWRFDLEGVRLHAERQSDGSWLLGPPVEPESDDLGDDLRDLIASHGTELTAGLAPALQKFLAGVFGFLTSFVITFMIAAFVLVDVGRVNRFIRSLVPREYRGEFEELWKSMDRGLGGVIRGQLLICLVNGALTFLGLVIFGIKYSFLLALLAGAFSLIPVFGTIVSSIPIVMIALVSSDGGPSVAPALAILAWIAGIHLLEANVLNPKIIGDSAHIHPVLVIFALLAGEHVYGLTGALLAIPVMSLVQATFIHARRHSTVFAHEDDGLEPEPDHDPGDP
ncbi:MAG: AI-2E family transporter [Myxococcales bacterium]|nr:AI-2E family transporter [Myxococcales bacterium]MCB9712742.1 AI-2E family transporter [Myxococcales bacterium]